MIKEEYAVAEDLGSYYRVPADHRDLNYEKYFEEGNQKLTKIEEYNSNNTKILTVSEIKEILLKIDYVQNELKKWRY